MSKEHAYAYEAGYRDGSINYELEHCPACKNVADLQEALAENAKLRELAGELWTYAEQELVCDENCPYGDTCDWMEPAVVCVFKRRMRELGVVVE